MKQYQDLLEDIIVNGEDSEDRTGTGTRFVWGRTLRFNLQDGFPIVTIRFSPFRAIFEETMMFLRGDTDTKEHLESKGIGIWKGNTSREFLDSRGLFNVPEGSIGKGYGFQWRNFGGSHWRKDGVDQLRNLIMDLKKYPHSRKNIVTAWNPTQNHKMALEPCHMLQQYRVSNGKLHSLFFMRSSDYVLATGNFNIPQYALINHIIANILDLEPGELVYMGADVHVYQNHIEGAKELLTREPLPLPQLKIHKNLTCVEDINRLCYDDVELIGYQHQGKMNFPMAI